jgi:hypothetical protein
VTVQESSPPEAAKATVWPFRSATVVIAVRSSGCACGGVGSV